MTLIMGIVNVTPDSFSDGGRFLDADAGAAHGRALRASGAQLLDVGGESTRPGAARVDPALERDRVLPVIAALAGDGAVVSVDTMNADTAVAAVAAGARVVNDVSGGLADPEMLVAVAQTDADVVLQHWRGHSADMYAHASYGDLRDELVRELDGRIAAAVAAGIAPERIVVDPGIGFGKRGAQNWQALRALDAVAALGHRMLVGTSRKRFLAETLATADAAVGSALPSGVAAADAAVVSEQRRDLATAVTSVLAAQAGAWAVRVHDVAATRDALRILAAWDGADRPAPEGATTR
ncbi:dihydropteroate synthase [Microbacterium telephonicum]|uniref:Dihydropteroate synthase n=1 Tax=Microbacterium telephonicum TaxID=1714841 RepID=A0A498C8K4_9MICO|nr:dihydropteroate synthase [Microbacterium telephonicum]RLK52404.1 dihydropteroate synthase [Microbacterium telephonicum]